VFFGRPVAYPEYTTLIGDRRGNRRRTSAEHDTRGWTGGKRWSVEDDRKERRGVRKRDSARTTREKKKKRKKK
jgi:hypothetical protein